MQGRVLLDDAETLSNSDGSICYRRRIAPDGLSRKSPQLEPIARVLRCQRVEIASHLFSSFGNMAQTQTEAKMMLQVPLELPVCRLRVTICNLQREINGSVNYDNQRYAPDRSRQRDVCEMVALWSGNCVNAARNALQDTYKDGLLHANGSVPPYALDRSDTIWLGTELREVGVLKVYTPHLRGPQSTWIRWAGLRVL